MLTPDGLNETIIIEQAVTSRHAGKCAWKPYAIGHGEVLSLPGDDGRETYQITLQHIPALTVQMRLSWKGHLLKILSIVPNGDESRMVLRCEEFT